MVKKERRKDDTFDEMIAYKAFNLKRTIKKERRAYNLETLIEIQGKRKVYFIVLGLCLALNFFLLTLGIIGVLK
ncbi:MAG: hypothetical protein GY804_07135 [Alphaproteobacteria bacterium]|nr:hypothetical protein [Alphaproteobacteria bacterium]